MIDAIDDCVEGAAIGGRIHDALMQCYQPYNGRKTVSSFLNKMKSQIEWCPSFDEVTELVKTGRCMYEEIGWMDNHFFINKTLIFGDIVTLPSAIQMVSAVHYIGFDF